MSALEFQHQLLNLRQQLFYFAISLTKDRATASDLLQDSLLRALTYRDKFREGTNFKAWTFTIMKNTFINDHRRTKRSRALLDRIESEHDVAGRVTAKSSTDGLVRMGEIERSLERLETTFREPFKMHHEGYRYHEIAERLAIPEGTVKSRIHQARQRLMAQLGENAQRS